MQSTHRGTAVPGSLRAKPADGEFGSHRIHGALSSARPYHTGYWGVFCPTVTGTDEGYPRQLESILGPLSLSSEQAKQLGVRPRQQISPYLELCCLRQSAIVSYAQAATEVEVQTGRRVSATTQQRLEARHVFEVPTSEVPVEQMSCVFSSLRALVNFW